MGWLGETSRLRYIRIREQRIENRLNSYGKQNLIFKWQTILENSYIHYQYKYVIVWQINLTYGYIANWRYTGGSAI